MIPETDVDKLLELYKGHDKQMYELIILMKDYSKENDKQMDRLLDLMKEYSNENDRNIKNQDRMLRIIEVLVEEVIKLKKRVLELEKRS